MYRWPGKDYDTQDVGRRATEPLNHASSFKALQTVHTHATSEIIVCLETRDPLNSIGTLKYYNYRYRSLSTAAYRNNSKLMGSISSF